MEFSRVLYREDEDVGYVNLCDVISSLKDAAKLYYNSEIGTCVTWLGYDK